MTLYKNVYYGHVLRAAKPELTRDWAYPAGEIEAALTKGAQPVISNTAGTFLYHGLAVPPRAPKTGLEKWRVVVQREADGEDWVKTSYPILV